MDAQLIDILSARDPRVPQLPSAATSYGLPMDIHGRSAARFAARYSNVAFGWSISTAFADAERPFPVHVTGRDHWLYRAYMLRIDSVRWYCPHVGDAWAIASLDTARTLRSKLCGMLLSGCGRDPDIHRLEVSRTTGIPLQTLEAFDTLFFNVLDRQEDALYISEQVYPHTRMVEFAEDYMKHADVADLIQRAGYNHRDLHLSSFLAGVGDQSYMAKLSSREDREQELTRQLMGNALLLVNAGALNQRAVGLSRAGTLLASSRQSGQTVDTPPVADSGAYMAGALHAAIGEHNSQRTQLMREDAGVVL